MKIVLLGCGNLITSIFEGVARDKSLLKQNSFFTYTPSSVRAIKLANILEGKHVESLDSLPSQDIYLFGFKPQAYSQAIVEYQKIIPAGAQIWSVLAGISCAQIEKDFPNNSILRIMPNICSKIAQGINLFLHTSNFPQKGLECFHQLFGSIGQSYKMSSDDELDFVTGVSGSGPALIFNFLHTLERSLDQSNLDKDQIKNIVLELALGSVNLYKESKDEDLLSLKEKVTSKKGVTQRALEIYSKHKLDKITREAIEAAYTRSIELRSE